ncbi:hypothetical protein DL93DRAFT_497049 [Clavulina sp. PMI_390]|nr:hypothetical protein DL93DRAFT_497049 [Clavulina sp. PMI_390]
MIHLLLPVVCLSLVSLSVTEEALPLEFFFCPSPQLSNVLVPTAPLSPHPHQRRPASARQSALPATSSFPQLDTRIIIVQLHFSFARGLTLGRDPSPSH